MKFSPSRDELGIRGLGQWLAFPHHVKSQSVNKALLISCMKMILHDIKILVETRHGASLIPQFSNAVNKLYQKVEHKDANIWVDCTDDY